MKTNPLLLQVMSVQSVSYKTERMQRFIKKQIAKQGLNHTCDKYGNIYVAKGDAEFYPTMVCHIDTVHDINNNVHLVQVDDNLLAIDKKTMNRYGIGGDDKVGIYITLSLLQMFENFKAVFFLDEEVGCAGSSQADFSFFDDSSIVLECDRRNITDFVTSISGTKLSDDTFINEIQDILDRYKRVTCSGGITDVGEIADNNPVQVANMSCGYYDPHTDNEYIKISEVESTKQMCFEIFNRTQHKRYEMDLQNRTSYSYAYGGYNSYDAWDYGYDDYNGNTYGVRDTKLPSENFKLSTPCPHCGQHEVWYEDYEQSYYCIGCCSYVDLDHEQVYIDELGMDKMSEQELIDIDTILYDASWDLPADKFKKDVEPKHINKNV